MKKYAYFASLCAFVMALCVSNVVYAQQHDLPDRVLWDNRPITVELSPNHEKIIHFPEAIKYWIPLNLNASVSALSANGVLYLRAYKTFDKTRIRVQILSTQKTYLLDIISTDNVPASDELIVLDKDYIKSKATEKLESEYDWFTKLTRFASQSLFAPERLKPSDKNITPIKLLDTQPIPLIRGGDIEAIPIESWQGGRLTVTSVQIRNTLDRRVFIALDEPKKNERTLVLKSDLRGNWLTVTPQHSYIGKATGDEAISVLYLVSKRSFRESL
jgi:integrating conjugative element protein (TIGR03749 family)